MMRSLNLDNIRMNVIETDPSGVVNYDTVFVFSQKGNIVSASYSGGRVTKGFLVGKLEDDQLSFTYCQLQNDGILDNGLSNCIVSVTETNKVRITENFEWKSRPGTFGTNIFQEI